MVHRITRSASIMRRHRQARTLRPACMGFLVQSVLGHAYKSLTCGYVLPGMVWVCKAAGHRRGGSSPSRTPALCPCRDDASPAADPIEARLRRIGMSINRVDICLSRGPEHLVLISSWSAAHREHPPTARVRQAGRTEPGRARRRGTSLDQVMSSRPAASTIDCMQQHLLQPQSEG